MESESGMVDNLTEDPKKALIPSVRTMVKLPMQLNSKQLIMTDIITFNYLRDNKEHFAIKLGNPDPELPLVRIHSECVTGDVFGSERCDCGPQLHESLKLLFAQGGYLLYLRQEGRGIGLYRKLEAYSLQDHGYDTYAANRALGHRDDERNYGAAADMLFGLGVRRIVLLSNNPDKKNQLQAEGIEVIEQIPTGVFLASFNRHYLEAKVRIMQHTIQLPSNKEQPNDSSSFSH